MLYQIELFNRLRLKICVVCGDERIFNLKSLLIFLYTRNLWSDPLNETVNTPPPKPSSDVLLYFSWGSLSWGGCQGHPGTSHCQVTQWSCVRWCQAICCILANHFVKRASRPQKSFMLILYKSKRIPCNSLWLWKDFIILKRKEKN